MAEDGRRGQRRSGQDRRIGTKRRRHKLQSLKFLIENQNRQECYRRNNGRRVLSDRRIADQESL